MEEPELNEDDVAVAMVDEAGEPIENEVELTPEDLDQAVPPYTDDDPNLALTWASTRGGEDKLREFARHMLQEFDSGVESCRHYVERFADDWKLLAGEIPKKQGAFKFCANEHIPIVLENISRLTMRAYGELFGDEMNVAKVQALGENDADAEVLSIHLNWQLREGIPDFFRQMHRNALAFFFVGDTTVHSYYDELREMNRHEYLTVDEFVIPYTHHTTFHDYSDVPWRAKVMNLYDHELRAYRGKWENVDEVLKHKASPDDEPTMTAGDVAAEHQGQDSKAETKYAPHKVILWEGWMEMPERERDYFVQAYIHYNRRKILKLRVFEEPTPRERMRYRKEMQELTQYRQARQAHDQQLQQLQQAHASIAESDALMEHVAMQGAPDEVVLAGMNANENAREQLPPPPPAPPAPMWMRNPDDPEEEPAPMKMQPIHLFSHGVCFEPLVGNLGLSFGRMQADHNRSANSLLNVFIDQGQFANIGDYFTRPQAQLPDGPLVREPGKMHVLNGPPDVPLKDLIIPIPTQQANPQLMDLVKFIQEIAQSSVQASDILSGEAGKSGETARGVAARIEQATKQISVVTSKLAAQVKQILLNNAKLNAMFLPDEQLIQLTDHVQGPRELTVGREMYLRNYSVEISADLRFATQVQRVSEADEMVGIITNQVLWPLYSQKLDLVVEVMAEVFRARGRYKYAQMVMQLLPILQQQQMMAQQMQAQQVSAAQAQQQQGGQSPQGGAQ